MSRQAFARFVTLGDLVAHVMTPKSASKKAAATKKRAAKKVATKLRA